MVERCLSFRVRRFLILVLVAMLAFVPICQAYGDDYEGGGGSSSSFNNSFGTVWYGPTASGLYVRYGVVANTKYDAALYCCKGSSFDLSDLTNRQKSKLLDNGDFKQFADLFAVGKPELTDDWGGDASIVQAWNSARQLYGETYCWNARYTNDQKIRAQEAIEDVLNDDDTPSGGVGSSGNTVNGSVTEDDTTIDYTLIEVKPWADSSIDINYIAIKTSEYNTMKSFADSHDYVICANYGGFADYPASCVTVAAVDPTKITFDEAGHSMNFGASYTSYYMNDRYGVQIKEVSGYKCAVTNATANTANIAPVSDGVRPIYYRNLKDDGAPEVPGGGGGDEPTEPPTDWPAPPTETPKPPDVPTPGDPVEPNPWIPIPDDDIDITGDDFQDLLDALNEHCIHLQNSIESNVSQLWDLESDFLGSAFEDLKSYLHELFEWLSEQLNFDVTVEGGQYDDTSVIYWLKQIWAKLPTGINTRPTDPVTDPSGWWDWLTQLLNNLAADLMALGHDKLAGVLETLNELRNKFPFSLPWDVAALLGLLVGVPVCPEFDMPCYTVSLQGLQEVGTYHITLEPYETVWEGVKWIETLAFAVYLIMNTGGLMDMVSKTVRPR